MYKEITFPNSIFFPFQVGIGNVWRFPYLAYKNGGGTFLIPYFILLLLVGKPMYYMETAIGQFSRLSPVQVWRCAPIAKGVGIAMVVVSLIVSIYYNVIMSYSLIYVGATFQGLTDNTSRLPWTYCGKKIQILLLFIIKLVLNYFGMDGLFLFFFLKY